MKRTTIKDIAQIVGVTHVTVSKVINNKGRISQETRKKVLDAIERLEYYPNYAARSLVKGKTNNIAVIEPGFSAGFPSAIISGIQDMHARTTYDINLYSSRATGEGAEHIFKRIVNEKRADAVIVVSIGMNEKFLNEYKKAGIPVILIESETKGASSILADNEEGAYRAAEYLIKKGRSRIGIVAGDRKHTRPQIERYAGFSRALHDFGIAPSEDLIVTTVQYSYADGRQAFKTLMEKGVDGIFSIAGDLVAYGLLDEARKEGLRVPSDISVIGFDDDMMSTSLDLTTVKQPIYEMGKKAFELAVAAAEGRLKKPQKIVFETEFKIRGTT
jgi:LacI family transcriptional regulator